MKLPLKHKEESHTDNISMVFFSFARVDLDFWGYIRAVSIKQ
jgi:hypothetical protein